MDTFEWIERELSPTECSSAELIFDQMDSQSGYSLPLIYTPFDVGERSHWRDRGSLFDFLLSVSGEGKKLLDFGPGDGWPSLIVAPFVGDVVGIDGSLRRVQVCTQNAERMGISNAEFTYVAPGASLPFGDDTFDGIMAASSVEQTPDPLATLREFYRVLRPGGRLRLRYEALGRYRGGHEREAEVVRRDADTCQLILYDRRIDQEYAVMYGVTLTLPYENMTRRLDVAGGPHFSEATPVPSLESVRRYVAGARRCTLIHPSGTTLASWLQDIGFREVIPSHSGASFAGHLFDRLSENERPRDMDGVDILLRPLVGIVVEMAAPPATDPMITAMK